MSYRRCRKTSAILLVMILLCSLVSPVHGESGDSTLAVQDAKVQTSEKRLVKIKKGETLYELAIRYGTTVSEIAQMNGIKNPNMIREGQELWVIPRNEVSPTKSMEEPIETTNNTKNNKLFELKAGNLFLLNYILGPMLDLFQEPKSLPKASVAMGYTILLGPYESSPVPIKKEENAQEEKVQEEHIQEEAVSKFTEEEIELLARVIHGEARGESFEGQVAVGAVVLNRLADPRFPNTIKDVIYQKGAFTAVSDKQFNLTPNDKAYRAAEAAIKGMDPTDGALYYYNPKIAMDRWIRTRPVVKQIGNHTFSI